MTIRVLHIGLGIRGRHWLDFVRDFPHTTTVACVEPAPEARALAAQALPGGVRVFEDVPSALSAVEADAALITSPSALHAEHGIAALEAGLAAMIEKPYTCTVAEALRVNAKSAETGRPVVVAENFRWVPAERTIKKLVAEGLIGAVRCATVIDRRRMPASSQGRWMETIEYPQLQEIAVHHFDSLRAFFGCDALDVTARAWNPPGTDYSHGSSTEAFLRMEGGLHVQYLGTLSSHKFSYRAWIEGDEGVLWTDRKRVWWRKKGARLFRPVRKVAVPAGDGAPYPREGTTSLLASLQLALEGGQPETSGSDNVRTIAMVEAGKRSDREGRTVPIEEVLSR